MSKKSWNSIQGDARQVTIRKAFEHQFSEDQWTTLKQHRTLFNSSKGITEADARLLIEFPVSKYCFSISRGVSVGRVRDRLENAIQGLARFQPVISDLHFTFSVYPAMKKYFDQDKIVLFERYAELLQQLEQSLAVFPSTKRKRKDDSLQTLISEICNFLPLISEDGELRLGKGNVAIEGKSARDDLKFFYQLLKFIGPRSGQNVTQRAIKTCLENCQKARKRGTSVFSLEP
jgi:hypothetical protein